MSFKSLRWIPVTLALLLAVSLAGCVEIGGLASGGICGIVILVLDIIAVVEVAGSSRDTVSKLLWILLIFILPIVGLIIYYFAGR